MSVVPRSVGRGLSGVAGGDEDAGDVSIEIRRAGAAVVVTARGHLGRGGESLLDHLLADLVVGQGNQTVIVDATSLAMADSAGLLFGRLGPPRPRTGANSPSARAPRAKEKERERVIAIETRRGSKVKVTFVLPADAADGPVSVVGDFNDWAAGATPMQREDGHLTASVIVDGGSRFAFRYLGDGGRWFDDEAAHAYEPNGMGGSNGVVEVAGQHGKAKQKA